MTIWLRWSIPDLLWDCAGGPWCWKATLLGYSPLIFGVVERAAMHAMPHSNLETIQNLLTRSPFEPDHIYINPNKNRADSYAVLNVTYCVFFFRKQQQPGNLVKSPKRTWKICASVGRMWMRRIPRPWHVTEMGSEDLVMRNSECLLVIRSC